MHLGDRDAIFPACTNRTEARIQNQILYDRNWRAYLVIISHIQKVEDTRAMFAFSNSGRFCIITIKKLEM
jgi:hypothetical protein